MRTIAVVIKNLAWLSLFVSFSTQAETDYRFSVLDATGKPLANAIIEPVGDNNHAVPDEVAIIDQIDKQFKPSQILVKKGQLVDFPNGDNIRHHVYSFSKAKTFELKLYADTPENPIPFPEHGVVVLGCNIHDTMIGYIFVSESSDSVTTNEHGRAVMSSALPIEKVNIWHAHNAAGPEKLLTLDLAVLPKDSEGQYLISMETIPPLPRNSFEDTFSGISKDY
jgi:plastocyanin